MDNAWMIRRDGKKFPVQVHIYGDAEGEGFDIYTCLHVCGWLYNATLHDDTKENIIELLAMWGHLINPEKDPVENIIKKVTKQPFKSIDPAQVEQMGDKIREKASSLNDEDKTSMKKNIKKIGLLLYKELNQEFLRARYGGMYDTSSGNKEMYFRVSSVGFNWFNIIWEFVYDMQSRINTVNIVRDEESTGANDFYYQDNSGNDYKQMDVQEFLMGKGRPVVESVMLTRYPYAWSEIHPASKMMTCLAEGLSLNETFSRLNMNSERAMTLYKHMNTWENYELGEELV